MRSFSAAVISFVFVSSVQALAIQKASTGSSSYVEDVSYSSSTSSGYSGHNSSGFGGQNAYKNGNFGTHNTIYKDYKNNSTVQTGQLDKHGNMKVDTHHHQVHHQIAPTTSYGTGTGYHNQGYSVTTPNFPQELYHAGGKGASLPYANVSGYDYNKYGGHESYTNPYSAYGAYSNQHAQYGTGYNSGYGATGYGNQGGSYGGYGNQSGSYGGYATYNPGNNYQHSYGATQYTSYGQPSYRAPAYGGYHGTAPLAAPVYGGYHAAPYVAPTPAPTYGGYGHSYGAPSYGGFGGFNGAMAGSAFVHGAIGNGPVSMQAPPAVQMPAPTAFAPQKGLSCHGKRSTGYDSPFLGAGLDDNVHTGCRLEDEVQAYAMDDDPWAVPQAKP